MTSFIMNIGTRHPIIAVIIFMLFIGNISVETAGAQNSGRQARPANRTARQNQQGQRQPRQRAPSQAGGKRKGQRPNMPGQRIMQGRPPRPGFNGPAGGRGSRTQDWKGLSQAQRAETMKFLDTHFPHMSIELKKLKKRNPEGFKRRIRRVLPEVRGVMEMMKVNPQRATLHIQERKLDMQMRNKARAYQRNQNDSRRKQLRKELSDLVSQAIDVQLHLRQMEISDLQARMGELAARLEEARTLRPQMIRQRVELLLTADQKRPSNGPMAQPRMPR